MRGSSRLGLLAAVAAMGSLASQVAMGAAHVMRVRSHDYPELRVRPERTSTGLPGMGNGTRVRGNRAVQRASIKKRNVQRHRALCRGHA
jgi:hypothetical protein